MLSKPLHVVATKLPSSETLGVKHSGFENLTRFYIVQQVSGFFNISDRRRLSRRRTAHLSLLASRSDSSRVRMSPSLTGPCVCYFSQRNHHKRQYEYNKYTNLDVPDDLTVALSNELNLHLIRKDES